MAIFDAVFGKAKLPARKFHFADGTIISAKEYGYFSGNQFIEAAAAELLDKVFKSAGFGDRLPVSDTVVRLPSVPHLYFLAFHTAIYCVYAEEILRADAATMADIQLGVARAVDDIRTPEGAPLDAATARSMLGAGRSFAKAIAQDMNETLAQTVAAPKQFPSRATKLLLGLVEQSFLQGPLDETRLLKGIGSQHVQRLQLLDDAPGNLLHFIASGPKTRLLSAV